MLPLQNVDIREYVDRRGRSQYGQWFADLDAHAAAKVTIAVTRMSQGNFSNVKGVGSGVFETRIDFGPGYRVYFGKDGDRIIVPWEAAPRSSSRKTLRGQSLCGRNTSKGNREKGNASNKRL
jgi:putative addiction module killer protein